MNKLEKFNNKLLIVGNLGELKVYKIKHEIDISYHDDAHTSHTRHKGKIVEHLKFDLLTDEAFIEAHKKISDIVTDKQGHYEGPFGGESGDGHKLELEIVNRLLKLLANEINRIVLKENVKCFLVFPKIYNSDLLLHLDDRVKSKIEKNIEANLVKLSPQEIMDKYILKK